MVKLLGAAWSSCQRWAGSPAGWTDCRSPAGQETTGRCETGADETFVRDSVWQRQGLRGTDSPSNTGKLSGFSSCSLINDHGDEDAGPPFDTGGGHRCKLHRADPLNKWFYIPQFTKTCYKKKLNMFLHWKSLWVISSDGLFRLYYKILFKTPELNFLFLIQMFQNGKGRKDLITELVSEQLVLFELKRNLNLSTLQCSDIRNNFRWGQRSTQFQLVTGIVFKNQRWAAATGYSE